MNLFEDIYKLGCDICEGWRESGIKIEAQILYLESFFGK